jgi:hypothetical protein
MNDWDSAAKEGEDFLASIDYPFRMITSAYDRTGRRLCKFIKHPYSSSARAIVEFIDGTTDNLAINSEVTFEPFKHIKYVR